MSERYRLIHITPANVHEIVVDDEQDFGDPSAIIRGVINGCVIAVLFFWAPLFWFFA